MLICAYNVNVVTIRYWQELGATLARVGDKEGMAAAYREAADNRVWPSPWQRPQHFALDDGSSGGGSKQQQHRKLRATP